MNEFFQRLECPRQKALALQQSVDFQQIDRGLKIKIPLPSLDEQKRIAYLLSKVEGLIAQRKQHLQQLDDLLKSVFLDMYGDPVRNEKGWGYSSAFRTFDGYRKRQESKV